MANSMQFTDGRMTGNFLDETTGKVNYASLRSSEEYRAYCAMAGQLRAVDVEKLEEKEKLAFFINVYNALTVHALTEILGERTIETALDVPAFWSSHAYRVGLFVCSLDDIEHGVLRVNKPTLAPADRHVQGRPRLKYQVSTL
nr:uncharacterized protein LOC113820715 [Penaeus vannamei]